MTPSPEQIARELASRFPPSPPADAPPPAAPALASTGGPAGATPAEGGAAEAGTVRMLDYARCGCHLEAHVQPAQVVAAAALMDQFGFALDTITGLDWLPAGRMEIVYDFFHPHATLRVAVRTRVPRDQPDVPTVSSIFPGANWHERETHDFFGIRFLGHPGLTPLLLPEEAAFHPLRKDFTG